MGTVVLNRMNKDKEHPYTYTERSDISGTAGTDGKEKESSRPWV
jgi:hypothetical protein